MHHAAFGHATERNVAGNGGVNNRTGARSQTQVFVELVQFVQGSVQIKHTIFTGSLAKPHGVFKGEFANGFFAVFHHGDVRAFFRRLHGTAKRHRATSGCLQTQCNHFQRMRQRQRFVMAASNERAHLRKAGTQSGFEASQIGDLTFIFSTVDQRLDHGVATPEVRAAECA